MDGLSTALGKLRRKTSVLHRNTITIFLGTSKTHKFIKIMQIYKFETVVHKRNKEWDLNGSEEEMVRHVLFHSLHEHRAVLFRSCSCIQKCLLVLLLGRGTGQGPYNL